MNSHIVNYFIIQLQFCNLISIIYFSIYLFSSIKMNFFIKNFIIMFSFRNNISKIFVSIIFQIFSIVNRTMSQFSISINKIITFSTFLCIYPIKSLCIFYLIYFISFGFFELYFIWLFLSNLTSFITYLVINTIYMISFIRLFFNIIYIAFGIMISFIIFLVINYIYLISFIRFFLKIIYISIIMCYIFSFFLSYPLACWVLYYSDVKLSSLSFTFLPIFSHIRWFNCC